MDQGCVKIIKHVMLFFYTKWHTFQQWYFREKKHHSDTAGYASLSILYLVFLPHWLTKNWYLERQGAGASVREPRPKQLFLHIPAHLNIYPQIVDPQHERKAAMTIWSQHMSERVQNITTALWAAPVWLNTVWLWYWIPIVCIAHSVVTLISNTQYWESCS